MNTREMVKVVGIGIGLLISSMSVQSATEQDNQDVSIIDIAGHEVPVTKGGLYDRFRSNPPLSVIRQEVSPPM
nr:hypothetical protein [Vibrio cidicii]